VSGSCSPLHEAVQLLGGCTTEAMAAPQGAEPTPMVSFEPWSCGFRPPGFLHGPRTCSSPDIDVAQSIASRLGGVVLMSETDSPFFPFVAYGGPVDDPQRSGLSCGVGLPAGAPLEIADISSRELFAWDDRRFGKDRIDEYYSSDEQQTYRDATRAMHRSLTSLSEARLPEEFIAYPVFWYGRSRSGNTVGVFAVRVDT
jgi:hypothetical protein